MAILITAELLTHELKRLGHDPSLPPAEHYHVTPDGHIRLSPDGESVRHVPGILEHLSRTYHAPPKRRRRVSRARSVPPPKP